MLRAAALAAAVRGTTSPNPWVGCVVVAPDGSVFEGATAPARGPHAEVAALAAAGPRARRSTLFCTLEPCPHQGRTPPCADAIVDAGVARAVVGLEDPRARARGRGIERLRRAGLAVDVRVQAALVG